MLNPEILAQDAHVPTNEELGSVSTLAREQQRLELEVTGAEKWLDRLKKDLANVAEIKLPDAMAAVGMSEFTLEDGYKVTVAPDYYANIPSADSDKPELLERREAAFTWLRNNGHEALIKSKIVVEAGKGENEKAAAAIAALNEAGIDYENTEAVHYSTLKAFVREQMEAAAEGKTFEGAAPFPEQTFGVHVRRLATIKRPVRKPRK